MDKTSTTDVDNQANDDTTSASTTAADSNTSTDKQTADTSDNLDSSKSTDSSTADGDKTTDGTTTKDGEGTPAPKFDDDIEDWAEKRKLPKPTTDDERVALQEQRDQQRAYTREQQAKKDADDLGKVTADAKTEVQPNDDDDELDPLEKRQNDLEAKYEAERTTRIQSEFYITNKVSPEEHTELMNVLKEKTSRASTPEAKKAAVEYWTSPEALPDLLDLAKARIAKTVDTSVVADEAAQKEREKIAQESQANSTSRNATTTSTGDKTPDEQRTERLMGKYSSTK